MSKIVYPKLKWAAVATLNRGTALVSYNLFGSEFSHKDMAKIDDVDSYKASKQQDYEALLARHFGIQDDAVPDFDPLLEKAELLKRSLSETVYTLSAWQKTVRAVDVEHARTKQELKDAQAEIARLVKALTVAREEAEAMREQSIKNAREANIAKAVAGTNQPLPPNVWLAEIGDYKAFTYDEEIARWWTKKGLVVKPARFI